MGEADIHPRLPTSGKRLVPWSLLDLNKRSKTMMRLHGKIVSIATLLLCLMMGSATMALAQKGTMLGPLDFLNHVLADANAPALTSEQQAQLNTLITNSLQTEPPEPDAALEAAHTAYNKAILAGDLAAAQAQIATITGRIAELSNAAQQATAKLQIEILAVLKSGGQLEALKKKFGEEHVVDMLG